MSPELIGSISGSLVIVSIIPYSIRTWQGKIQPNITSWLLWTLIGLALLLTYRSSGADSNVWPAVFGFTNPLLITILVSIKKGKWEKLNTVERICWVIGILSLAMWWKLQHSKELVQYALYVAILADACAAIPTVVFVWHQPDGDRPFAWGAFAIGYGLAILAITKHTFANWVLPLYMFLGSGCIAAILASRRIKQRAPLTEWI